MKAFEKIHLMFINILQFTGHFYSFILSLRSSFNPYIDAMHKHNLDTPFPWSNDTKYIKSLNNCPHLNTLLVCNLVSPETHYFFYLLEYVIS